MALDLFPAPKLSRQSFASPRLSVVPVIGEQMEPTLRGWWDYVLAAPVKSFQYDSVYVLDMETGGPALVYRCQRTGRDTIRILYEREPGRGDEVPLKWFNEHVLGIVVCDLKVRDADRLKTAWEDGQ
jgi:hypothetical protein